MHGDAFQVFKAVCAALIFSLVFALVFTLVIQLFLIPLQAIKPVNQIFKIVAVAFGGLLFIRGEHGFLKGAIYGAVFAVVAFFAFGLLSCELTFNLTLIFELILNVIAGSISGILAVNFKNRQ